MRSKTWAVAGLVVAALCWSGNTVLARFTYTSMPPIGTNFWRWCIALAILLPLTWRAIYHHWPQIRKQWLYLSIQALLAISLFNTLLYKAAHSSAAVNINLINAAGPAITFLFSWWLLKTLPRINQVIGLCLAFAGLLVVVSQGQWSRLLALQFNQGDWWMSLGMVGWCLYSVRLRQLPLQLPPLALLTILVAIGIILMLPFYLWELSIHGGIPVNWGSVGALLYMGVLASVVAFYYWNRGVHVLGPNVAAMFQYLLPLFAGLQAYWFLDEPLAGYHLWGEILMFSGFYISVFLYRSTTTRVRSCEASN